jgi:hypothetical protein
MAQARVKKGNRLNKLGYPCRVKKSHDVGYPTVVIYKDVA